MVYIDQASTQRQNGRFALATFGGRCIPSRNRQLQRATPQNMLRPSRVIAGVAGGIAGFSGAALALQRLCLLRSGCHDWTAGTKQTVQKAAAATGNATGTVTVATVKFALSPVAIFEKARAANLFKQQVKIDNGQAPGYEFLDIAGGFIAKGKQQRGDLTTSPTSLETCGLSVAYVRYVHATHRRFLHRVHSAQC